MTINSTKWPLKALSSITTITMGQSPPGETYNSEGNGLPFFQGKAEFGEKYPNTVKWCTAPSRIAEEGDILMSVRAPVGPVNIAPYTCCIGRGLAAIRPNPSTLNLDYLWHFFGYLQPQLSNKGQGSTFAAINKNEVEQIQIPLPPLPEQKRIAAILDKADAIRRKRAQARELTDQFLQSVFLDMFGDPVTNPKGWPQETIDSLVSFMTSGSRGWARYYSDQGDLFLRIQNIGKNALLTDEIAYVKPPNTAEAKRTKVQEGDVLLSITADLGRTAVIPKGLGAAYINQHLALLRVKDIEPLYLSAYLASSGGERQINLMNRSAVKSGLNFDNIRSLSIPVPRISQQKQYASIYHKVHESLHNYQNLNERTNILFESLTQDAFRGEL